ncbi:MAG: hypothetical protein OXU86_04105 [Thaumarchaeota archaeon]|nr:hypothetical protein [Nitrososphaerota archaeon]MDD9825941.1 hypothetical protein [Nitrososphaerota archaeon]
MSQTVHFVGLGVLCTVGTIASIQTGPFPLNFVVGGGIMLLFAHEATKKIRQWRTGAQSHA